MDNILDIVILILEIFISIKLIKNDKNKGSQIKDFSLVEEVSNYIGSKGMTPIIQEDEYGRQFFGYQKDDGTAISLILMEDLNYKKGSLSWKNKRGELLKAIDEALTKEKEENK
ncbi:MAG: hypothetical protein HUJ68_10835 [Clostridia bacterium]|nr:hypothetical protein [Clostridia bacterium]